MFVFVLLVVRFDGSRTLRLFAFLFYMVGSSVLFVKFVMLLLLSSSGSGRVPGTEQVTLTLVLGIGTGVEELHHGVGVGARVGDEVRV